MGKAFYASFLTVALVATVSLVLPANADGCPSVSFLYKMIDTSGVVSDRMTAVLRPNSQRTREIIGDKAPFDDPNFLGEGGWIATFYFLGDSFNVTKLSNSSSNWRNDQTYFFKDGYVALAKFDLLALSSIRGNTVEYDLLRTFDHPPSELLLTVANFRDVYTHLLEAGLYSDPSGASVREKNDASAAFLEILKSASGTWKLVGCFDSSNERGKGE